MLDLHCLQKDSLARVQCEATWTGVAHQLQLMTGYPEFWSEAGRGVPLQQEQEWIKLEGSLVGHGDKEGVSFRTPRITY